MGSYGTPNLLTGIISAADYTRAVGTGIYRFMKLNSTAKEVVRAAADEATIGILQNEPNTGQIAEVATAGGMGGKLQLGGTVAKGDYIKSDANGDGVVASAGEWAGAIALEAGVDNDIVNVLPVFLQVPAVVLTALMADVSTASTVYMTSPVAGKISLIQTIIDGAIATADAVLTGKIGAVAITTGVVTIANAGSAAGDVDSASPTAANVVAAGSNINVTTNGASTNTVAAQINVVIVPKTS